MRGAKSNLFLLAGVGSLAKAIENLLVAAHHPEFLARDPLLGGAVALHQLEEPPKGIDLPLKRIHLAREGPRPRVQHVKIPRAVFPALHREKERDGDERPPDISLHRATSVASSSYSRP